MVMGDTARLLERCRRGDQLAWERLVTRYERLVSFIARSYGLGSDECDDVTQSTFAELLTHLDDIDEPSHLSAWLATVARRTTWRALEQQQRRADLAQAHAMALTSAVADHLGEVDQREWLAAGLTLLDSPCRELLTALFLDPSEPSYEEVARQLGRPSGSLGPTRRRCLEKLGRALERPDGSTRTETVSAGAPPPAQAPQP